MRLEDLWRFQEDCKVTGIWR